jgi:hypothetical protein
MLRLLVSLGLCSMLYAQDEVPLQNTDLFPKEQNEQLEVETVEINQFGAIPAEIHRPAGKFILLIIDRTPDHAASLSVAKVTANGDKKVIGAPLLRVDKHKADSRKHRMATMVSAPPGEFDVMSDATGDVLCKFIFE